MLECPHFAEDIICILALNLHAQEHTHTHTLPSGRVTLQAMSQVRENIRGMKLVTKGLCLPPSSLLRI